MAMNKALWPGTLGYYLEELLELDLATIGRVREFFTSYVTGRGPLPPVRVGTQPYGLLLTSDFARWKWSQEEAGEDLEFLNRLHGLLGQAEATWQGLVPGVPHVGETGDPFQNLLSILGLQSTSAEFHRRHVVGKEYLWNYDAFTGSLLGRQLMAGLSQQAENLLQTLSLGFDKPPKLFDLAAFEKQDAITDPLVDDIPADETEKWSESKALKSIYRPPDPDDPSKNIKTNYIGWLAYSDFDVIKKQDFKDMEDEPQPVPRPLLYRMLRGALLQAYYDATMQLYATYGVLPPAARREVELCNIDPDRTVTHWEFMEAEVGEVFSNVPELKDIKQSIASYLQQCLRSNSGSNCPQKVQVVLAGLREVQECLKVLSDLSTARLERIFVEHLDLCTYRLDAWQTGCFHRRLQPPPPKPPVITSFTAAPDTINQGDSTVLSWSVINRVTSLTLEPGVGDVTGQSSATVSPTTTTTYTLTATNGAGSITAQVTVTVNPPPSPKITRFDFEQIKPDPNTPGPDFILRWTIINRVDSLALEPGVGDVTGKSSVNVSPTTTTTYTLTATNSAGSDTAQTTIRIIE
jgi:hypothetical protein